VGKAAAILGIVAFSKFSLLGCQDEISVLRADERINGIKLASMAKYLTTKKSYDRSMLYMLMYLMMIFSSMFNNSHRTYAKPP
jgi:hypothetical protein